MPLVMRQQLLRQMLILRNACAVATPAPVASVANPTAGLTPEVAACSHNLEQSHCDFLRKKMK
jgi:hypothetical protein